VTPATASRCRRGHRRYLRAGLGTVYAHPLRNRAATAMLARGGSLAEIGQECGTGGR
jgi:hypothetical protein